MLLVDGINIEKEIETPYNIIATYPSFQILTMLDKNDEKHIERCGRTCYKSEHKITADRSDKFINMIIHHLILFFTTFFYIFFFILFFWYFNSISFDH